MPRYVVVALAHPHTMIVFGARIRGAQNLYILRDAALYDGPLINGDRDATAFALAVHGPAPGTVTERAPRFSATASGGDVVHDVTLRAKDAWHCVHRLDMWLVDCGPNRISVIKTIREITGLGLREAKDLTDATPRLVIADIDQKSADDYRARFGSVGAGIEIRGSLDR